MVAEGSSTSEASQNEAKNGRTPGELWRSEDTNKEIKLVVGGVLSEIELSEFRAGGQCWETMVGHLKGSRSQSQALPGQGPRWSVGGSSGAL